MFAVAANLVERSGAYRQVVAPGPDGKIIDALKVMDPQWREEMRERASSWSWGLIRGKDEPEYAEMVAYCESRKNFRNELLDVSMEPLKEDWLTLVEGHGNDEVLPTALIGNGMRYEPDELPQWWQAALRLLITADTACQGIGFIPRFVPDPSQGPGGRSPGQLNWVQYTFLKNVVDRIADNEAAGSKQDAGFVYTVTDRLFNEALGAVLPKTRTSTLGCTLRSLSHNLALVPAAGLVQARWRVSAERPLEAVQRPGTIGVDRPLKLLLVPFPYRITADCFSAEVGGSDTWGYFDVKQKWLPEGAKSGPGKSVKEKLNDLAAFVASLVRAAARSSGEVNGVVFPEFSLDAEAFNIIAEHLREDATETGFEFIVAGLSEEPVPPGSGRKARKGNFAAFLGLSRRAEDGLHVDPKQWGLRGAREKHHRWKLNKAQIRRYSLSTSLSTRMDWWEGIPISPRVVEFFEVRGGTSLTVLICEDLARSDPCQQVVRAVGPNLVIALLMDGPQRAFRWPAHYAGVLADDPGSSVLSFTSLGLVDRSSATDPSQSRSIAFFKDSTGVEREIPLPQDSHAVLLSLEAHLKEEHTLDGRGDGGSAFVWQLNEVTPVRANTDCVKDWILGLE